ncbi:restriction endonuclease subunit S [Paenibacillus chitinolyticus]
MAKGKKRKFSIDELLEQALIPADEQPYELPENWIWTKMENISFVTKLAGFEYTKHIAPNIVDDGIPLFKGKNVQNGELIYEFESYIPASISNVLVRSKLNKPCLLTPYVGTIGNVALFDGSIEAHLGSNVGKIELFNPLSDKFVLYFLRSDVGYKELTKHKKATAQESISIQAIRDVFIPIPPLAEQHRMVDRIESLFAKLDQAKELAQNALDSFETRKVAILNKAFSGELTAKWREEHGESFDSWRLKKLGQCGVLERGRSQHRPRNAPELFGGPYPFIQTGDVAKADVYVIEHKQTLSEAGLRQSRLFPKGTLCITIAANIGDVAILSYDSCFPDSIVGFSPNSDNVSKFIYYLMSILQKKLETEAPATAQKNINLKVLNDVGILAPSFAEQQEIVRILDNFLDKELKAKELVNVIEQIDLLKKAILARAFRGELGTNDPNEETAKAQLQEVIMSQQV